MRVIVNNANAQNVTIYLKLVLWFIWLRFDAQYFHGVADWDGRSK